VLLYMSREGVVVAESGRSWMQPVESRSSPMVGRDYCATMTKRKTRLPFVAMPRSAKQFPGFNVSLTDAAESSAAAKSYLCQLLTIRLDFFCSREGQWKAEGDIFGHTAHWRTTSGKLFGSPATMGQVAERCLSRNRVAVLNR
jgi:hypothetical protein